MNFNAESKKDDIFRSIEVGLKYGWSDDEIMYLYFYHSGLNIILEDIKSISELEFYRGFNHKNTLFGNNSNTPVDHLPEEERFWKMLNIFSTALEVHGDKSKEITYAENPELLGLEVEKIYTKIISSTFELPSLSGSIQEKLTTLNDFFKLHVNPALLFRESNIVLLELSEINKENDFNDLEFQADNDIRVLLTNGASIAQVINLMKFRVKLIQALSTAANDPVINRDENFSENLNNYICYMLEDMSHEKLFDSSSVDPEEKKCYNHK